MPDRFEAMSFVVRVADIGSLSAAARQLGIPLATVSRKVAELEAYLRTPLFQRSSRGLVLTEAGRGYVASSRRIIEDVLEAEKNATGEFSEPKGSLVITAPVVFGKLHVLPVVVEFLVTYPQIDVRLVQTDRLMDLPEEHIDVALRIGKLPDSALMSRNVGSIRRVVCGSPAYLARAGMPQHPEDLGRHDCITFDSVLSPRSWPFRTRDSDHTVAVRSRLTVNTAEAAISAALEGLGVTSVLSYQVSDYVARGELVTLLEDFEQDPWPVNMVYPSRGPAPQKIRAFLDFATPRLRQRLDGAL